MRFKCKFSIIVASHLSMYPGAAKDREYKFFRAISSVIAQRFADWECIIVADGCVKTKEIYEEHFRHDDRISLIEIPKQKLWSQVVRNTGLDAAQGEWICYTDTDDFIGEEHLEKIIRGFDKLQDPVSWVYFNHYIPDMSNYVVIDTPLNTIPFKEVLAIIDQKGKCGTCNIAHRNQIDFRWNDSSYLHDFLFIKLLKLSSFYSRIPTPSYYCCHEPNSYDV